MGEGRTSNLARLLLITRSTVDWNKIWHGWLRRGRDSVPQTACQSVQGR